MTDPLIGYLTHVLRVAAQQRSQRSDWIEFERNAMWKAVNDQREKLGRSPIPIQDVERVEGMAVGHTDYALKFALYCADLVYQK